MKGEVPVNTAGEVNVPLLASLDWSRLSISSLWPHIRDHKGVQQILNAHCASFKLEQILWVAQNDPENCSILLKNDECMRKVSWDALHIEDYRNYLFELPVYSISNLRIISEKIIIEGLIRGEFEFPDPKTLCDFLNRVPLTVLSNQNILYNFNAVKLFNVNCFIGSEFLVRPMSSFLFNIRWTAGVHLIWNLHLLELVDYLKTFPDPKLHDIFHECERVFNDYFHDSAPFSAFLPVTESSLLFKALQDRDPEYFAHNLDSLKEAFHLGPFDQYRILLALLSSPSKFLQYFDTFIAYFEAEVFEDWLLRKFFFTDQPEITASIYSLPVDRITSTSLLQFFSLKQQVKNLLQDQAAAQSETQPVLVPMAKDLKSVKSVKDLTDSLTRIFTLHLHSFKQPSFRIKYAADVVVDLGGPLLDWISGILQLFVDFGLVSSSTDPEVRLFLDPKLFYILGLLHGKLLQLGSGPHWIPSTSERILDAVASLAKMYSEPAEAVRLFNDFEFPRLEYQQYPGKFRVCSHAEIDLYLVRLKRAFSVWKSEAWSEYQAGLDHFLLAQVPKAFVKCLLEPQSLPTPSIVSELSRVKCPTSLPPYTWKQVLETFSAEELIKLLIFVTGQCRPVPILVYISRPALPRLPHAQTCFRQLFLYLPTTQAEIDSEEDDNFTVRYLAETLKTSIYNYQGFGNT